MNTTCTPCPWTAMNPGQVIGEDVMIPPGDITIVIRIGDGESPCKRGEASDCAEPRNLHAVVSEIKKKCTDCAANTCCCHPIKGIGIVIFQSWDQNTQTLTVRLCYKDKR